MDQPVRILHLEDDPADAELAQAILESAGMVCQITRVQTREGFGEALHQGGYDVILADYRFPTYDGMSALRLAQQLAREVPFIFVSGTMGEDAAIEGLTEGATDYVLKHKLSRLVPAVGRALHEAENRRERKRAEEALRVSEQRKTILNQIANIFLTVPDDEMYAEVLAVVLQAIKSEFGLFGFIAENGDLVIPSFSRGIWNECQVSDKSAIFPPAAWGESLWGKAIREKKPFCSDGPFHTPEGHIHISSFLTVPIVFGNETIGLISLANGEQGYTGEDIVEDILESRLLLRKLIESVGFEVREAANGQEAIEEFERWEPHLIWMDMRMPVMDGLEATRRIKAGSRGRQTKIIGISASIFEEQKALALTSGCDDFVRKPFREADILETMRSHLGVSYEYATESMPPSGDVWGRADQTVTAPEALSKLPPDLLAALEHAAESLKVNDIQAIIEQIREVDQDTGNHLANLAKEFRYDLILTGIRQGRPTIRDRGRGA